RCRRRPPRYPGGCPGTAPATLPANQTRGNSRQGTQAANLTGNRRARLFVGGPRVHAELLELAGEGVASPAQEARRFLAVALGTLERDADQDALELRLRRLQQRLCGRL